MLRGGHLQIVVADNVVAVENWSGLVAW